MVSETRRAVIRQWYRMRRLAVEKTQIEVESLAKLNAGQFWKIENGFIFPTDDERSKLAKVLRVNDAELPSEQPIARSA